MEDTVGREKDRGELSGYESKWTLSDLSKVQTLTHGTKYHEGKGQGAMKK